jgi:hypothetical protein
MHCAHPTRSKDQQAEGEKSPSISLPSTCWTQIKGVKRSGVVAECTLATSLVRASKHQVRVTRNAGLQRCV